MREWPNFPTFPKHQFSFQNVFSLIIIIFVILIALGSFYFVGPAEAGILKRFGKIIGVYGPGLHWKIPIIDSVHKIDIAAIRRLEIGFRTIDVGPPARYQDIKEESLLLTKDGKIVDLDFVVQYQISDPVKYLMYIRGSEKLLRDLSQASMRQVVGNFLFDEILTISKDEIQNSVKNVLQDVLSKNNFGIKIINVQLQDVVPPEPVQSAFQEVINAKSEKDKLILEAQAYYNQIVPEAEGQAAKIIAEAEAYKNEQIEKAKGDAQRFKALLERYNKTPSLMKTKLYMEALEMILPQTKIIIIDDPKGSIKIFNLPADVFTKTMTLQEGGK
ncbi:MAG: FtsH protease activity modulator HflK [Dictyoglomus sp.]|nr:FtsH protease activity modulator HflK [Dictyoglomus sp.]MCX7942704.1 FtsH protease activity modulator HflK [Dictyoglomaceae bacterium]MDW8187963.1 FtsH protease activity modulator HflK [Dictyoglomus sp.]